MARSAIPDFYKLQPNGEEWPEYVYHPFPRQVGLDAEGEQIIANSEEEYDALLPTRVFPKVMGKDKAGRDVIAQIPRDLEWLKASVITPPEDPAVIRKREEDAAFAAAEIERKAKAYDDLMAANALKDQTTSGSAVNAATGLKKSKAA